VTALVPLSVASTELERMATDYMKAARAPNTVRSYRQGWQTFERWCRASGRKSLPATPETVLMFAVALADAGAKAGTIDVRLRAIGAAHETAGLANPCKDALVKMGRSGIRRKLGTAQRRARPLLVEDVRAIVATMGDDLTGRRDRAMILLGFAGALRRSELVALNVEDVAEVPEGLAITIRRSKTDQEGAGRVLAIPEGTGATDPVKAWRRWLEVSEICEGPAFRPIDRYGHLGDAALTTEGFTKILKRYAAKIGLDPSDISGHSLRSGFATTLARAGVPFEKIAEGTRHASLDMVRVYVRTGNLFRDPPAAKLGL